jgi:hypothetical protein
MCSAPRTLRSWAKARGQIKRGITMMIKIASCFALACSVMVGGCVGDAAEVDTTRSEDAIAPQADANGVWTKVTEGVWERTRPSAAVEHYAVGVPGMTWMAQQQREALDAFQKEVGGSSGAELREDQQKNLDVLRANLDATETAVEELSLRESPKASGPGLQPEYFASSAWLGSCADFLVAGPTSGTGAYAESNIDSACFNYYLSAYVMADGVGGSISTTVSRGVSAGVNMGTFNCTSQAYAQANGWGHTLTYPYCN